PPRSRADRHHPRQPGVAAARPQSFPVRSGRGGALAACPQSRPTGPRRTGAAVPPSIAGHAAIGAGLCAAGTCHRRYRCRWIDTGSQAGGIVARRHPAVAARPCGILLPQTLCATAPPRNTGSRMIEEIDIGGVFITPFLAWAIVALVINMVLM